MRYHRHDAAHKGFSKDRDGVCPKQLVWGGTQGRKGEGPATERLFIQVRHENGLSPLAHGWKQITQENCENTLVVRDSICYGTDPGGRIYFARERP